MAPADDVSPAAAPSAPVPSSDLQAEVQLLHGQLQAATEAAARAVTLFTHAPAPMLLVSSAERVVDANLLAASLLGHTPAQLTGRRLAPLLTAPSQGTLTTLLKAAFSAPGLQHGELTLLTPDGQTHHVLVDIQPCIAEGAAPTCHLILRDVTAVRAGHEALLNEMELLQAEVRDLQGRQRRADEEVKEVIRSTGMQLHVQLARVQNLLDLHHREVTAQGRAFRYLDLSQDALKGTFALLGSLEQYLLARGLRLRPQSVNLDRVLREVHKDLRCALDGRVVEWPRCTLPTVLGDSRALQMVLREYLGNALKFTRAQDPARIRVRVVDAGSEHWIGVEDNGVGFNMRQKERIFELFSRLHSTREYEGAGIGLAVVRQLCERMGGRAWAEGKVGQGATFWFACPKAPGTQD